jgi:hypothetical protein
MIKCKTFPKNQWPWLQLITQQVTISDKTFMIVSQTAQVCEGGTQLCNINICELQHKVMSKHLGIVTLVDL